MLPHHPQIGDFLDSTAQIVCAADDRTCILFLYAEGTHY
jgi:hypothetical protein